MSNDEKTLIDLHLDIVEEWIKNQPVSRHLETVVGKRRLYFRRGVFGIDMEVNDLNLHVWNGFLPVIERFDLLFPLRVEWVQDRLTAGNLLLRPGWRLYGDTHEYGTPCFVNSLWGRV